jgi:hypothetical protein
MGAGRSAHKRRVHPSGEPLADGSWQHGEPGRKAQAAFRPHQPAWWRGLCGRRRSTGQPARPCGAAAPRLEQLIRRYRRGPSGAAAACHALRPAAARGTRHAGRQLQGARRAGRRATVQDVPARRYELTRPGYTLRTRPLAPGTRARVALPGKPLALQALRPCSRAAAVARLLLPARASVRRGRLASAELPRQPERATAPPPREALSSPGTETVLPSRAVARTAGLSDAGLAAPVSYPHGPPWPSPSQPGAGRLGL